MKKDQAAIDALLSWGIKPGQRIYTKIEHVSRSGMSRVARVYYAPTEGAIDEISRMVARAAGYTWNKRHYGLNVGGCGFDAGFDVVYSLGHALFGQGFTCIGEHCPSNDHSNGDRDYAPHMHSDAGYALRHRSL